ncbi:MAG: PEP-CTERM/exosortase system-associated acyltransferase [Methyloprofundus sp.]|nr:PEP-CTERM/exosortase system-associated acyltransferase [Methyloprofundus sp.]
MKNDNIITPFNEYFEMVPALSDELKNEAFKLRYQVYCIETGFEKMSEHPGKIEVDDFDENSAHYLIRHRKTGAYAATTRLILPNKNNLDKLFPIELFSTIDNPSEMEDKQRRYLAEASRFCVSKEFKKRKGDSKASLTGISLDWEKKTAEEERRTYPHLSIALYACLIRMSHENNIKYWYAVMEPALIRFFATLGIYFIGIGPVADYHGMRRPCVIRVNDLLKGVYEKNPAIWEMMSSEGRYGQSNE